MGTTGEAAARASAPSAGSGPPAFRHEALFYAGVDDFVDKAGGFIRDSVAATEPILVVVSASKIERLRADLDGGTGGAPDDLVWFADMAEVGTNPARIIPAWHDFVDANARSGHRFRGIGEPIWAERSAAELAECVRHEALLNLAFAEAPAWWLLCPYDTESLPPEVLREAERTHPFVRDDGGPRASDRYAGLDAIAAPFAEPLPDAGAPVEEMVFDTASLRAVRRLVSAHATAAGLDAGRAGDLVLAADEVATNSIRHGGGSGTVRMWREGGALLCEVSDRGGVVEPLAGRRRPSDDQADGRGLWLANQLCDLVQVRTLPDGGVVRLHMRVPG